MLTKRKGKRQIRLVANNVSRFSPRTARRTFEGPRRALAEQWEGCDSAPADGLRRVPHHRLSLAHVG